MHPVVIARGAKQSMTPQRKCGLPLRVAPCNDGYLLFVLDGIA
jgi:hypothetical protein